MYWNKSKSNRNINLYFSLWLQDHSNAQGLWKTVVRYIFPRALRKKVGPTYMGYIMGMIHTSISDPSRDHGSQHLTHIYVDNT